MKKIALWCCLLLSCFSVVCHATDLMDIYYEALENDEIFKQAYDNYMSTAESIPQARSALYPQVTLGALAGRQITDSSGALFVDVNAIYNGYTWTVNASQTIFNYQAWTLVQQAKASVKAAQAVFNDSAQDLILRTATAYYEVLFAKDTLNFAEAKLRANKRQLEQAEQRYQVGLDPITSVYEAKAAFDQSTADVISAQNNQINRNEELRRITNHVYEHVAPLRNSEIPLIKPEPENVDAWIDTGLKQNYKLYAAKFNMQAARENIRAKAAGNWPVLSIQSSTLSARTNGYFTGSKNLASNLNLVMTFPVLQGGLTQANTRQAQYDFQSATEQMEQVYRYVIVNSRVAYNNISTGIGKVKADRQTVISQQKSLSAIPSRNPYHGGRHQCATTPV